MSSISNRLFAGLIFVLLIPLYILIALWILFQSGTPVLFKQKRLGLNGKFFFIIKFRTMVSDAEDILNRDEKLTQSYIKNDYKLNLNDDPRLTECGRILRKWSLDEFPQFINVIRGDMNLVGPRPIVPKEIERYSGIENKFLSIKPGITGLWQINGRSKVDYPERRDMDMHYIDHRTLKYDIWILWQTIFAVISKRGVY